MEQNKKTNVRRAARNDSPCIKSIKNRIGRSLSPVPRKRTQVPRRRSRSDVSKRTPFPGCPFQFPTGSDVSGSKKCTISQNWSKFHKKHKSDDFRKTARNHSLCKKTTKDPPSCRVSSKPAKVISSVCHFVQNKDRSPNRKPHNSPNKLPKPFTLGESRSCSDASSTREAKMIKSHSQSWLDFREEIKSVSGSSHHSTRTIHKTSPKNSPRNSPKNSPKNSPRRNPPKKSQPNSPNRSQRRLRLLVGPNNSDDNSSKNTTMLKRGNLPSLVTLQ